MAEEKPPQPEQPKTVAIPKADKNEILLAELKSMVAGGFAEVHVELGGLDTKVDRLEANQALQGGQVSVVQSEIRTLFEWKGAVEARLSSNSMRAAATSSIDLDHEAKIAATITKTDLLEKAIHETRAIVEEQSTFMGIGKRGVEWLRSPNGTRDVIRIATLIGVAYATLRQAGVIK